MSVDLRQGKIPEKTVFVSAVALVDADHRVLIAQRPEGKSMAGLWEFPGGKVEAEIGRASCRERV